MSDDDVVKFVNHFFPNDKNSEIFKSINNPSYGNKTFVQPYLEELVCSDMRAENFNPLNRIHVNQFWREKGIEV